MLVPHDVVMDMNIVIKSKTHRFKNITITLSHSTIIMCLPLQGKWVLNGHFKALHPLLGCETYIWCEMIANFKSCPHHFVF